MGNESPECIVLNSSPIIALAAINLLEILIELFPKIIVPPAVYEEVAVKGSGRPGSKELGDFVCQGKVKVLTPRDRPLVEALHDPLGMGESEAIALAIEHNCIVILDDRIARVKARSMRLNVKGTIGLLRLVYDKGLISKDKLVQALRELKEHGFRISSDIINEVLEKLE
ncbi:MAG: DUF3368 domain-containing protein [Desulfurococcales archaeon]|nr:DUF3368 domain-containing protein [Desulfurococcales archaeon]